MTSASSLRRKYYNYLIYFSFSEIHLLFMVSEFLECCDVAQHYVIPEWFQFLCRFYLFMFLRFFVFSGVLKRSA